jgi:hypothetical protein
MLSRQEDQRERERVLRNDQRVRQEQEQGPRVFAQDQSLPRQGTTFHQHALADATMPRGRFTAVEAATVAEQIRQSIIPPAQLGVLIQAHSVSSHHLAKTTRLLSPLPLLLRLKQLPTLRQQLLRLLPWTLSNVTWGWGFLLHRGADFRSAAHDHQRGQLC